MKKDAYYFPHFSNARNDAKLLKLRRVLGLEGYGIFFCLLEILRDQTDFKYPLENLAELEYELRISKEKISTVIMDYDLFTVDSESKFFSPKMILYLQPYIEKSELQREKALKRWGKVGNDAAALPRYSHGNASKVNQTKENETKPNQIKETEPDFETFERWTKDLIDGKDFYFTQKFQNSFPNWGGGPEKFVEIAKDHLDLLNRYPKMNPNTQERFRNSVIKHFREYKNKPNGAGAKKGFDLDGAKNSIADYIAKHG